MTPAIDRTSHPEIVNHLGAPPVNLLPAYEVVEAGTSEGGMENPFHDRMLAAHIHLFVVWLMPVGELSCI